MKNFDQLINRIYWQGNYSKFPDKYHYGRDVMENVNVGRSVATNAIIEFLKKEYGNANSK